MPCDRRYSPTVRSCQELARIGQEAESFFPLSSSSRYVDGIKVLAEQFNQRVLAMVRKAAERAVGGGDLGEPAATARRTSPTRSALPGSVGRRPSAAALIAERASRNAVVKALSSW